MEIWESLQRSLLVGALVASGKAMAGQAASCGRTAEALITAYGSAKMTTARVLAEVDYEYAIEQLAFIRMEVKRLMAGIETKGAEDNEIVGDEIRALRIQEETWQRAVGAIAGYIKRFDRQIAQQ